MASERGRRPDRHRPAAARPRPRDRAPARPRRCPRDRGYVTAEAAVVLPVLVAFTVGLMWMLLAAVAQLQCVDAARAGARAAARQEPRAATVAAVRAAAPRGARVEVRRDGPLVRVTVTASSPGPDLLAVRLRHEAVAFAEEDAGGPPQPRGGNTAPAGGSAGAPAEGGGGERSRGGTA